MAKVKGTTRVPKIKGKHAPARSRAARRAASPTEKLDLPNVPTEDAHTPDQDVATYTPTSKASKSSGVLAAQHSGSITKKKKQKPLTRQQRLRREKGLERAEIVMDQKETAVEKSKNKGRRVQNRRAAWEELNGTATLITKAKVDKTSGANNAEEEEEWEDADVMVDAEDEEEDLPDPSAAFVGFGGALEALPADEIA